MGERFAKAVLIFNPAAGYLRRATREFEEATQILARLTKTLTLRPTSGPLDAGRFAREEVDDGCDLIVVCGGDGTINEVVNGIAGSPVPVGVLPGGTANVLAVELGLGRDLRAAARMLGDAREERVALGRVRIHESGDERYFLLMAGAGLDARVVYELDLSLKERHGKLAYVLGALRAVRQPPCQMEAIVGEERIQCSFALTSRVRNYGGAVTICEGASLLKEDFEVVLFDGRSALAYLGFLASVVVTGARGARGVSVRRTRSVELHPVGESAVWVQIDGEFGGRLPATIDIVPSGLSLLVPDGYRG